MLRRAHEGCARPAVVPEERHGRDVMSGSVTSSPPPCMALIASDFLQDGTTGVGGREVWVGRENFPIQWILIEDAGGGGTQVPGSYAGCVVSFSQNFSENPADI